MSKDFPHLNENTQAIFGQFAKIYREEIIEAGKEEVQRICAEYKQAQSQELGKENLSNENQHSIR